MKKLKQSLTHTMKALEVVQERLNSTVLLNFHCVCDRILEVGVGEVGASTINSMV